MKYLLVTGFTLLGLFTTAQASDKKVSTPKASAQTEVEWALLAELIVPPFEEAKKGKKPITTKKLAAVLGQKVVMKGFMMPLDFTSKDVSEFLLMPYVPNCMHVPPPPSNNLVVVNLGEKEKIKATFYPVEVEGVLNLEENIEFESSYKLVATKVTELDPKRMNEDDKKKLDSSAPNVNHGGGL